MLIRTLKLILVLVLLAGVTPTGGHAASNSDQKPDQTSDRASNQTSDQTSDQAPEFKTVEAMGTGFSCQGDAAAARARAVENGLALAVHMAVQELLPPNVRTNRLDQLDQALYLHAEQFIQDYRVMAEISRDGMHRAVIQARVSLPLIEDKLKAAGVIGSPQVLPKVLLVMSAEGNLPPADEFQAETYRQRALGILAAVFEENGFPLIQAASQGTESKPPGLDLKHALAMARRLKAEVLVMGRLSVEPGPISSGGSVQSAQGRVALDAYATGEGNMLASGSGLEVAPHYNDQPGADKAVAEASSLAAGELVGKLSAAWQANAYKAQTFEVVVEEAPRMLSFVGFRRALSSFPRVKSVQTREMQRDRSVLTVSYLGSPQDLAQALDGERFEDYRVKVSEITPSQVKVRLLAPEM